MRRAGAWAATALAAGTLAAAGEAYATPAALMLSEFDQVCLAPPAADPDAVGRAALQAGWLPMPESLAARFGAQVGHGQGWFKNDSDGMQVLLVGEQSRVLGGMQLKMRACGVGASSAQLTELTQGLQTRAAVPPSADASVGGQSGWVFRDHAGRHQPLGRPNDAEARMLAKEGSLRFLMVIPPHEGVEGPTMMLLLAAPPT